jgi:dsDNA-specific endonuclease/ATPase MutS2
MGPERIYSPLLRIGKWLSKVIQAKDAQIAELRADAHEKSAELERQREKIVDKEQQVSVLHGELAAQAAELQAIKTNLTQLLRTQQKEVAGK